MDRVWTNVDPFCPYFTNLFAAVVESSLSLKEKKKKFFPSDPKGLSRDDTGYHIRQSKSRLKPLSLSSNIYMPFHYILHCLCETRPVLVAQSSFRRRPNGFHCLAMLYDIFSYSSLLSLAFLTEY